MSAAKTAMIYPLLVSWVPIITKNFDESVNEYQSITCTISIINNHSYIGGVLESVFLENIP